MPVFIVIFEKIGNRFFDASTLSLWLFITVEGLIMFFGWIAWARFVPAKVSLVLAVFAWTALFFFFYPFK